MKRQRSCTVWIPLMGLLSLTLISLLACTRSSEPEWTPILQDDFTPGVSVTGKLVPAAWTTASSTVDGQVTEILVKEGESATSGIDCFVLSAGAFTPRGTIRPEQWKMQK